jgi:hypothetical protein
MFEALSTYYDEIGISNISCREGIQNLDFDRIPSLKIVVLTALINGGYKLL